MNSAKLASKNRFSLMPEPKNKMVTHFWKVYHMLIHPIGYSKCGYLCDKKVPHSSYGCPSSNNSVVKSVMCLLPFICFMIILIFVCGCVCVCFSDLPACTRQQHIFSRNASLAAAVIDVVYILCLIFYTSMYQLENEIFFFVLS